MYLFLIPSSSSKKMMDERLRLPYTSVNELPGSDCNVVLMIEITGVMPLPAANARYLFLFFECSSVLNLPVGGKTSSSSPGFNDIFAKLENAPPSTFFTATRNSFSKGDEQME